MSSSILILVLIIVGIFFASKLRGPALKRSLKLYTAGAILGLGGCLGSLVWLGGETSGNTTAINEINPYIFAACFVIGVLVLVVNSVMNIKEVNKNRDVASDMSNEKSSIDER